MGTAGQDLMPKKEAGGPHRYGSETVYEMSHGAETGAGPRGRSRCVLLSCLRDGG